MIAVMAKLPRLSLGCFPTPLVEAKRLSAVLGGPRLLIKREDLSGLALGGNKCRKFEFLLADVIQRGFDSFLVDSTTSNTTVQLAAAAAKLDIKVKYIIYGEIPAKEKQGNYVLHRILDSEMKVIEPIGPAETLAEVIVKRNAALEREAQQLREEGYNPFVMRTLTSTPVENAGWVNAVDEIRQQMEAQGIEAQYLVVTTGQGATHAGLALGAKYLKAPFRIIGISNIYQKDKAVSEVVRMCHETAEFLNLGTKVSPEEITVYDDYIGEGYGAISKDTMEVIKLVAKTEGIFLDPVYTGKTMGGLIDLIHKGKFTARDTVVFIHTGGVPALFVHSEEFTGE